MSAIPTPVIRNETKPIGLAPSVSTLFLQYLPAVRTHAEIQFRNLPEGDREEAVAEAVASALVNVNSAINNGKSHRMTASTVARYAVLHVKDGRHVGGSTDSTNDVMSRKAQQRRGFKVLGLDWDDANAYDCMTDPTALVWKQSLLGDLRTPVSEQAAFRIDWSMFLRTQSSRTRTALTMLAAGHSQTEVADRLGITPAAVCQRIKRAQREWVRLQQGGTTTRQKLHAAAPPTT